MVAVSRGTYWVGVGSPNSENRLLLFDAKWVPNYIMVKSL